MEQLNRIELRGVVGTAKTQVLSGNKMCRFSVATSRAYKDKDGIAVIDTTWHNVIAWDSERTKELSVIKAGSKIYVCGRLHTQKYTGQDGVERTSFEVVANKLNIIESDEPLQYEM